MAKEDFDLDTADAKQKPKPIAGRKRASIAQPWIEEGPTVEGKAKAVGADGGSSSTRATATGKRRSTMI